MENKIYNPNYYVEIFNTVIEELISCNAYSNSISTRTFSLTSGYYLLVVGVGGASATNYGDIAVSGGTSLYLLKNNNDSGTYSSYCQYQGLAVYLAKVDGSGSISCSFKTPNHCKSSNAILYKLKDKVEKITPTPHTTQTYSSEGTRTYTLSKGDYLVATTVCGGNNSQDTYGAITVTANNSAKITNFQNAKSYGSGDYTTYLGTCCCEVKAVNDNTTLSIKTLRNGNKSVAVGTIIVKLG